MKDFPQINVWNEIQNPRTMESRYPQGKIISVKMDELLQAKGVEKKNPKPLD